MLVAERGDLVRAQELLERAKTHAIPDLAWSGVTQVEGMLALEGGNAPRAIRLFDETLSLIEPNTKMIPTLALAEAGTRGYLALACAALGDRRRAEAELARAEPLLRANRRHRLLTRCQAALDSSRSRPPEPRDEAARRVDPRS
jgi:hypothetical protein